MPKRRCKVARDDLAGLDDQLGRQRARHVGKRDVDGDRHDPQVRARRASSPASLASPKSSAASAPRNSVWPGNSKAGGVQRLLLDRIGDDRRTPRRCGPARRRARIEWITAGVSAAIDRCRVRRRPAARLRGRAGRRQRARRRPPASAIAIGMSRPSSRGAPREKRRVADEDERRNVAGAPRPARPRWRCRGRFPPARRA